MADEEWTEGFLPRGMALIGGQMNQLIESEAMSAEARIVFDAADRPHEAHAADVPHLRDGWIALSEVPRTEALFTGASLRARRSEPPSRSPPTPRFRCWT